MAGLSSAGSPEIQVVTGRIDHAAAPGSAALADSAAFLEGFPAAPSVIYLDLTVAPRVTGEGDGQAVDFSVTLYDEAGARRDDVPCALGQSGMIDRGHGAISFAAGTIYPHLVLTAGITDGESAPFNALSCDYAPAETGQVVLRLTGFFVVQQSQIPTARDVRLVPYLPPHDAALQAIGRAVRP